MPPHKPHLADSDGRLSSLLRTLSDAGRFDHPVEAFEILETHISYVLLTGPYAYKFKKAVDFGFVNFNTLERRKYYCEQELRLNRRLAPELYVEVVPVTGSVECPALAGPGPVIEYAVKMRQFDSGARLDRVVDRDALVDRHVDSICEQVARLHADADTAGPGQAYGTTAQIRAQTLENFVHLSGVAKQKRSHETVEALRAWSARELDRLDEVFEQRRRFHRIKECHGDLHLANMALYDGDVVVFDCIEFNESLRWCDVMSEVAFFCMDLDFRRKSPLARRFLNDYLARSGDYNGLAVWRFYLVYRALVRAKVAHLRFGQGDTTAELECDEHLRLAHRYALGKHRRSLGITRGLSGSGKSTVTQALLEQCSMLVRVRSDIERKRLIGLAGNARTHSEVGAGAYSPELTRATYARLAELAQTILATQHSVIVDATFLSRQARERFLGLAKQLDVPFYILDVKADTAVLERRLVRRNKLANDAAEADVAVLHAQLASSEALSAAEKETVVSVDTEQALDPQRLAKTLGLV